LEEELIHEMTNGYFAYRNNKDTFRFRTDTDDLRRSRQPMKIILRPQKEPYMHLVMHLINTRLGAVDEENRTL
jgi:hypothetical protein